MDDLEPWTCTVVRAYGLHLMRPERSWRPIVVVELDNTHQHETILGSDGQNVNQKDCFPLRDASLVSRVEIKVFYRSQSKKKGKKRNLVGSASCTLGDMWKKHGREAKLELRLQCQNPTNRSVQSRGRPQNGALIHLRLRPPPSFLSGPDPTPSDNEDGYFSSESSSSSTSSNDSNTLTPYVTEVHPPQALRRRRRVRGYCVDSDQEPESYSETDTDDDSKPLLGGPLFVDDDGPTDPLTPIKISFSPMGWIAASLLPQYTERIEVPTEPDLNFFERAIASFTVYNELKRASCDDDFDRIFTRLQVEWTYTAGILVALAAVDTAVFSISPGAIFEINPGARNAIAASSIASGLGIACAAWFLVRYSWVNLQTFIARAEDVLSTPDTPCYFFFALTSRIPSLLMLASAISLMVFMAIVAFSAWPTAVIVGCFLVGLLMGLQFLVFTIVWVAKSVRKVFRFLVGGVVSKKDPEGSEMNEKQ
ncbi:hypothetical protein MSAN_00067000 [Mycena sanguinolenta]|uniref:C2 domain-containing protein n=1 Tax=Mycena sanguinolenta TaxID=230812 RepID=A0A8H7DJG8_9AGAR|nr:hypothetical protein MSAN_00067000 [Mycena sanguinolenta]